MDESWRRRMGMQTLPRKKMSPVGSTRHSFTSTLDADDFSDVFGGPPRTLLTRKYSADFTSSSTHFYSEIFRTPSPELSSPPKRSGRILPAFTIPSRNEGFYSDIFASRDGRKSRERSRPKSNSSSVLSSEELSPLRPPDGDDVALSSFASKLRPINVPCRWNSTSTMPPDDQRTRQGLPAYHHHHHHQCHHPPNQYMENDNNNFRSSYYGSSRRVSSPETISIEPNSYRSIKLSTDDTEFNSPSSPASSLCQEPPDAKSGRLSNNNTMQEQEAEQEDQDEVMSSYVIEINSDYREGTGGEAVSVDEAIAWAKEKFQTQSCLFQQEKEQLSPDTEERPDASEFLDQQNEGHGTIHSPMEEQKKWTTEDVEEQSEENREMELLEQEIRLWSAGKETNIRLLLSTLHHVRASIFMLWPNSGWMHGLHFSLKMYSFKYT
ncbi:hypothetical protein JRO89_XS06G0011700 [Xanthoceras sorbifolium]|uniref:Uncharacterized protein n=1 Tax=Xanthoceras sorbifolium TaxID=99658 RepID=A0ABQ8HVZ7_9ROSI|nr:hypothetical protein JRO89_XS06G0011700 [Xanthoceras sorbifolium]